MGFNSGFKGLTGLSLYQTFFFVNVVTIQPTSPDIYQYVILSNVLVCQMRYINKKN